MTTDVGLSPPYNSLFTFFGQFFDHGVDQTVKSGGTVFVPLRADDPLITLGPDGKPNTGDEVPPGQQFMVLTRAQNQPGPDGVAGRPRADRPGCGPLHVAERAGRLRRVGRRRPERQQHRHALGRSVADLHLARRAPGVPARVRAQLRQPPGLDRQAARRPARRPDLPEFARRPGRHRHVGGGQEAGRRSARPEARRQGRGQRPDDRDRPVRQVHPRARSAAYRSTC